MTNPYFIYTKICFTITILLSPVQLSFTQILNVEGSPSVLEIRAQGDHAVRITLKPDRLQDTLPYHPALSEIKNINPEVRIKKIEANSKHFEVGNIFIDLTGDPLTIRLSNNQGEPIQTLTFLEDGHLNFKLDEFPVLGMGEGGPKPEKGENWKELDVEFDRRGRMHNMQPRWQGDAYGSRNPVPLLIGTGGWAIFFINPWGIIDLTDNDHGIFIPIETDVKELMIQDQKNQQMNRGKGIPPAGFFVDGLIDLFVFDAHDPVELMKELSILTGPSVLPPKWALGYMQSHRTLQDDSQMIAIIDSFRSKKIPIDAAIYLGTGFCPRGWNTRQPSFDFNPEVFKDDPGQVISELHKRDVKVVLHMVPWDRDKLPTLHGSIPPLPGEKIDSSHILCYWKQHENLISTGVDAFWPDEGDWFNLFERMKRHQMYYQGPLLTTPDTRPWSLHRNGYPGIAKWGGWIWSGDTQSSWKTLEAQIAVGINHSLSLSPFWGSDIGGFYPGEELTGELYARWFQFGAFCPSFRAHGRTWWTRLPWGWGLNDMGPIESRDRPLESELNNPAIEPICRKYDELRYMLMPYTYTVARETRTTGLPMMRSLWLHYPDDNNVRKLGDQYLWGRDIMVAPVYTEGATHRTIYLPEGNWYDWWTGTIYSGGVTISREVTLSVMPIFVRAGAIIPIDPVRQYTSEVVSEPTTIRIYSGANGSFRLYEDDGSSLDYLHGVSNIISFSWNDELRILTIEPEQLGFGDPDETKSYVVEIWPEKKRKMIDFNGTEIRITFE